MNSSLTTRPYILMNCAVSLDGYLDDASNQRLVLSGPEDLERVDSVRAKCDAILVGANTIRKDNPSLILRSEALRKERIRRGQSADPLKVTVTRSGKLEPDCRFFKDGHDKKLVYCVDEAAKSVEEHLASVAEVRSCGAGSVDLLRMLADLHERGVQTLLVEGGSDIISQFLT